MMYLQNIHRVGILNSYQFTGYHIIESEIGFEFSIPLPNSHIGRAVTNDILYQHWLMAVGRL